MGQVRRLRAGVAGLLGCLGAAALSPAGAAEPEGRALFQGRGGAAQAATIAGIRQSGLSCAGCHGRDGSGDATGSAVVPPIDAASLMAPTPLRPPYDEPRFARAVRDGISSAGRPLSLGMPRFELEAAEIGALWRFLEALPAQERRGIAPDAVRFAILTDAAGGKGKVMREALERAWNNLDVAAVNGRAVRFELVDTAAGPAALDGFFAVVAADLPGDGGLLPSLPDRGIPVLGPRRAPSAGEESITGVVWLTAGEAAVERIFREEESDGAIILRKPADIPKMRDAAPGRRVLISSLTFGEAELAELPPTQADLVLLRPSGDPTDPEALADALALVLRDGLAAAGRDLTQTRFLRALSAVRVSPDGWAELDYTLFPSTGTDAVDRLRLSASASSRPAGRK